MIIMVALGIIPLGLQVTFIDTTIPWKHFNIVGAPRMGWFTI